MFSRKLGDLPNRRPSKVGEISEAKIGSDEQIFGLIEQISGDQSDYRDISLKVIWDTFPENALEAQLKGKDDEAT